MKLSFLPFTASWKSLNSGVVLGVGEVWAMVPELVHFSPEYGSN
jgi:hypothetical protein